MAGRAVAHGLWGWLDSADTVLELDAQTSAAEVLAVLHERGLDARTLDLAQLHGKSDLIAALHRVLGLDDWFGFNWDALEDALHGPEDTDAPAQVLVCTGFRPFQSRAPEDAEIFLDIVRSVASTPDSGLRGCVLIP